MDFSQSSTGQAETCLPSTSYWCEIQTLIPEKMGQFSDQQFNLSVPTIPNPSGTDSLSTETLQLHPPRF